MKLFAIVFLIVVPASFIIAQPEGPPQRRDMVNDLKTKLQLTSEQTKKVEAIFDNNKKKMESLFGKRKCDPGDMKKNIDSLINSTNKEIGKILSKEQSEKFKRMIEERKSEMDNMPPPPPPQGRFDMERGIIPPQFQLGFSDRTNIDGEFGGPEMPGFMTSKRERPGMNRHMHTRCGRMEGEGFLPPPPPGRIDEDDDFDLPSFDDFFDL